MCVYKKSYSQHHAFDHPVTASARQSIAGLIISWMKVNNIFWQNVYIYKNNNESYDSVCLENICYNLSCLMYVNGTCIAANLFDGIVCHGEWCVIAECHKCIANGLFVKECATNIWPSISYFIGRGISKWHKYLLYILANHFLNIDTVWYSSWYHPKYPDWCCRKATAMLHSSGG